MAAKRKLRPAPPRWMVKAAIDGSDWYVVHDRWDCESGLWEPDLWELATMRRRASMYATRNVADEVAKELELVLPKSYIRVVRLVPKHRANEKAAE